MIIPRLNVCCRDEPGTDLANVPGESPKDVATSLSAGSCEVVLTALVSKEDVYLTREGVWGITEGQGSHLYGAFDRIRQVAGFKRNELPLSVTLKIEPVNVPAQVDAASAGVIRHE